MQYLICFLLQTRRGTQTKSWQSTYTLTCITPLSEIEEEDEKNLLGELLLGPEIQTALNRKNKNKFFFEEKTFSPISTRTIYYWKTTAVINNFSHFFSFSLVSSSMFT
jgi:hypothetical protein